jgi:hypothetical protein
MFRVPHLSDEPPCDLEPERRKVARFRCAAQQNSVDPTRDQAMMLP